MRKTIVLWLIYKFYAVCYCCCFKTIRCFLNILNGVLLYCRSPYDLRAVSRKKYTRMKLNRNSFFPLLAIELFSNLSQGNTRFVWFSSLCQIYSMHLYFCFIVSWVLCHKKFSFFEHVHTPYRKKMVLFSQSFRPRYVMCSAAFDCLSCLFTQCQMGSFAQFQQKEIR